MYPQLPNAEQLATMSAADLRNLASQIRAARRAEAAENTSMSAEEHDAWTQWGVTAARYDDMARDAEAEEFSAAASAATQRSIEALAAADPEPGDEGDDAGDAGAEPGDDAGEGDQAGDEASQGQPVPAGLSLSTTPRTVVPERTGTGWRATGIGGTERGVEFATGRDIGEVIAGMLDTVAAGDTDKRILATMSGNFSDAQRLSGEQLFIDLARLSETPDEVTAAFCTPLMPTYNLACANVTRRPVFNGLPQFTLNVDRGGVRIPESPSLYDITGGYGQWTSTDDANLSAIKNACQTMDCVNWNDFEWYATYRCLKIRNMTAMVFPELVDAYLNRLFARWARYAEVLLLEQMGTASTNIDGPRQAFGANVSLQRIILTYLGLYQEIERWDVPMMDAWMPRWLLWALRMDIASRRKDGSGRVPSIDEVEQTFRDVGVEPHWYMDRPSWATPVPNLATSGDLNFFPSRVEILIHRRGKFAVIDKGSLNLGLGGNPIRIDDDVRRNQATFFVESFEGLVDTDSCPAHIITVPGLCYNGRQIADAQIECEGYDLVGVGS